MNKTAKFIKNMGLTVIASVAGGIAGAELSDLVTDSKTVISISSTSAQYILSFATFFPLHAKDNKDLYREPITNKFKWGEFAKDAVKMTAGFGVLDYLYIIGRPFVNYKFQKAGYDPSTASLLSDAICIPTYCILALPMAKGLGVLRENKNYKNLQNRE